MRISRASLLRSEITIKLVEELICMIKEMGDIIDELYVLLMQHITVDEAENITRKIRDVAKRQDKRRQRWT